MTWNPAIRLPEATAPALVFVAAGVWFAYRGSIGTKPLVRSCLLALRTLGLIFLALIWLNPGRWIEESETARRDWLALLGRSARLRAEHAENVSRWQAGTRAAEQLRKASGARGNVHIRTFASQLEDETDAPAQQTPDGYGTDLGRAVAGALDQRA